MMGIRDHSGPIPGHVVHRDNIYEDFIKLYQVQEVDDMVLEYPVRLKYANEKAWDKGGVSRDALSQFWDDTYAKMFDGGYLLTPVISPESDLSVLPTIGRILSHGYLATGVLPVRIAFPVLAGMLLGSCRISDSVMLATFQNAVSTSETEVIRQALSITTGKFPPDLTTKLIGVLGRFQCRDIPTPGNLEGLLVKVAKFEFQVKPMVAITSVHCGIPKEHKAFWENLTVEKLYSLYLMLTASPTKVIACLEPECTTQVDERIFSYLESFIGNMNRNMLCRFLRFCTGSSTCIGNTIKVRFNSLSGLARRPTSHTCEPSLDLPVSYTSYDDFTQEFEVILSDPKFSWEMDAI